MANNEQAKGVRTLMLSSDVPCPAWTQCPDLGWALAGLGFTKLKLNPELRAWLGLFQNGNTEKSGPKNISHNNVCMRTY
jgi:hypothetical protein